MINRMFAQMEAFEDVTLSCDRCERHTPLAYLYPVANLGVGFVCRICLHTMPYEEFRLIRTGRHTDG